MLRSAVADGTALGKEAEAIMAAGDLVPDDLVVALVAERLALDDAQCGFLLDGFPRNVTQAVALDAAIGPGTLEMAVLLDADAEELVRRLLKRAAEQGRSDDNEDTIRRRLDVYSEETEPLVRYYPEHSVDVIRVQGVGSIDEVFSTIVLALANEGESARNEATEEQ